MMKCGCEYRDFDCEKCEHGYSYHKLDPNCIIHHTQETTLCTPDECGLKQKSVLDQILI